MGLIDCRAKLMLEAKKNGVVFASTLTLGRQKCNLTEGELAHLRQVYGIPGKPSETVTLGYRSYADEFFRDYLNVEKLSVMDFSDYDGAEIIHDLNYPIDENLEGSFDVVVDGGTLEHIFNFPTAIGNCMKMLKVGGNLFIFSMANNHCGHGFYQFSPELFFRILQPLNGFEVKSVILVKHPFPGAELSRKQTCFKVKDPEILGRRSNLVTRSPLGIMVHALKVGNKPVFEQYPQQSDYIGKWQDNKGEHRNPYKRGAVSALHSEIGLLKLLWSRLPLRLRLPIAGFRQLWNSSLKHDNAAYNKWL